MTTFQVVAPVTVESGKPNKGFGGARKLYGDLRDSYPETFKHLDAKVKPKGSQFKSQAEQIAEAKQRLLQPLKLVVPHFNIHLQELI